MTERPGAQSSAGSQPAAGSRTVAVSVAQLAWQEPCEGQHTRTAAIATAALRAGSDVVILPELAVPGYTTQVEVLNRFAQPLDGPAMRSWRKAAAGTGGYVVGGFCERADGKLFNSTVAVGAEGVVLHYRKTHLFADEKTVFTPGDIGFPVIQTGIGKVGVCVCYDLRFVEVARLIALQGAELLCVPTAWIGGYDRRPPDPARPPDQVTGLLTQANLNQIFIAAASFSAGDGRFLGSSVTADPTVSRLPGRWSATGRKWRPSRRTSEPLRPPSTAPRSSTQGRTVAVISTVSNTAAAITDRRSERVTRRPCWARPPGDRGQSAPYVKPVSAAQAGAVSAPLPPQTDWSNT